MRIALVEIGEKGGVREVLQARAIVSHHVCWSWQVESDVAVPMGALVSTGEVTEVRRGTVVGDGTFGDSGERWGVVGSGDEGGVLVVSDVGHQSSLGEHAAVLHVAVGDVALEVVKGDHPLLDVLGESEPPGVTVAEGVEEHTTHTCFCCVRGPQERGVLGH